MHGLNYVNLCACAGSPRAFSHNPNEFINASNFPVGVWACLSLYVGSMMDSWLVHHARMDWLQLVDISLLFPFPFPNQIIYLFLRWMLTKNVNPVLIETSSSFPFCGLEYHLSFVFVLLLSLLITLLALFLSVLFFLSLFSLHICSSGWSARVAVIISSASP